MAGPGFSPAAGAEILNNMVGKATPNWPPSPLQIALYNGDPQIAGAEATYTGYARLTSTAGTWNNATTGDGEMTNLLQVQFAAKGDVGTATLTHVALVNATLGVIKSGAFTGGTLTLAQNEKPTFAIGEILLDMKPSI